MTTDEQMDTAILRRLTPARKVAVMTSLWRQAWALKAAGVRLQHPEWTSTQVNERVREIFHRADT